MATDLTSIAIKDGFQQLLHCNGGLASTETDVLDGDGTASIFFNEELATGVNNIMRHLNFALLSLH